MTPPELRLWLALRTRPDGLQFRRQHPFGPYVFDFFCIAANLAIEVDGMAHSMGDNPHRDARRDDWASRRGIRTLRVLPTDIHDELDGVVSQIVAICADRTPPSSLRDATSP